MRAINDEGMSCEDFNRDAHIDDELLKNAVKAVVQKININLKKFGHKFPESATVKGIYPFCTSGNSRGIAYEEGSNVGWTTSFWTGILLLAFEHTRDEKLADCINIHIDSFIDRIESNIDCNTHDLGFLYCLSCVAMYKLNGDEKAKKAALMAADYLMSRYIDKAGIIQAWGDMGNPEEQGRMIIDCLMNLPLLYWASEVTGDEKYKNAAYSHGKNAAKYSVRDDGTTYHTYFFDVNTGKPKFGETAQGYSDDSCWARGQAWAIYGFALSYFYTKDEDFLDMGKITANYFLKRSPEDYVAYWDLIFNDESNEEKDSSASAIAACGLLEMAKHLTDKNERTYYTNAAKNIIKSLITNYAGDAEDTSQEGLLLHGVYIKTRIKHGVDESNLWGDYFYFEALSRLLTDWKMYW